MWEYVTVFVLAATPLVELLVVIPLGVGYGIHPLAVALLTFAGNTLPVLLIAALWDRARTWRGQAADDHMKAGAEGGLAASAGGQGRQGRQGRARRIWARYGMPGLSLLAPLVTGVHLAAIAALALGSSRRSVTAWMVFSIALWTAGVTLASVAGVELFRRATGG
jgi:Ca2+/H+ antiporter, TMEM165/GDT1 family